MKFFRPKKLKFSRPTKRPRRWAPDRLGCGLGSNTATGLATMNGLHKTTLQPWDFRSGAKMRGAIVLLMVGLLTSTEVRANDFVDRTWPFFQRYAECAVSHFHKLGWKSKKPFDEIEGTVAPVCGGHIDRMRQEMSRLGISNRKEQNVFIRRAYDGVVASFEDAYFASQYMEWIISEDDTGQRWFHCLKVFAVTVAETTDEPAETIANAAMHSCRNERQSFMALLEKVPRVWKDIAEDDFFTPLQEDFRQEIIAEILTMRAKAKLQ